MGLKVSATPATAPATTAADPRTAGAALGETTDDLHAKLWVVCLAGSQAGGPCHRSGVDAADRHSGASGDGGDEASAPPSSSRAAPWKISSRVTRLRACRAGKIERRSAHRPG